VVLRGTGATDWLGKLHCKEIVCVSWRYQAIALIEGFCLLSPFRQSAAII
jgi:hypothetical protein